MPCFRHVSFGARLKSCGIWRACFSLKPQPSTASCACRAIWASSTTRCAPFGLAESMDGARPGRGSTPSVVPPSHDPTGSVLDGQLLLDFWGYSTEHPQSRWILVTRVDHSEGHVR